MWINLLFNKNMTYFESTDLNRNEVARTWHKINEG